MPSLGGHLLISLKRFTGRGQVQLCARLGGGGPDKEKAQFLHLRNLGRRQVPAVTIKEVPAGQQVGDRGKIGPKNS